MRKVVLDTNCLIASLSSKSENFQVWRALQRGMYILCVSNEILEEYHEVIARLTTSEIADNVLATLVESEFVEFFDPRFHLELIKVDPDDNKFVDCAFVANATYIVSNDSHFDVLSKIDFPKILVLHLDEFLRTLK
ncbi:MAG: putative toxin-antitoxin system toxin component, PIN family [Paludibacteraceae bacterium]|nr:putative toxin-antitoxin system toxin component, PIN family [Paludibacteraceae bacterium]